MLLNKNSRKLRKINPSGSTSVAKSVARRKFHFTRERINALPNPTNGQRSYFYDAKVRGLAVAVSPLGKKTFILYRKIAGKPERITIGPFTDLSIEQARGIAEQKNSDIALGRNPAADRRAVRDEMTLGELFATFLEHHAKPHKKTWQDDIGTFNLHLGAWKLKKISELRKMDVQQLHAKIGKASGHYAANRVVELLCTMFNRAKDWGWEGDNPAERIKAFREKKRDRFMDATELRAFFQSLSQELNENIRDFLLVCLLTGARRDNCQAMRWPEINWERATWIIPGDKAKGKDPIDVPLVPAALGILKTRKAVSTTEWVFPGIGRTGHLVEPKTAWKRILTRAGLWGTDLRLHDVRRTLGSWQAAQGTSLPIIGKSLGHKSLSATQIYARLDLDPVRASVVKATDAMLLAGGLGPAGLLEGK